jgi:hypothetical protein
MPEKRKEIDQGVALRGGLRSNNSAGSARIRLVPVYLDGKERQPASFCIVGTYGDHCENPPAGSIALFMTIRGERGSFRVPRRPCMK